jgi:hypothetical protein
MRSAEHGAQRVNGQRYSDRHAQGAPDERRPAVDALTDKKEVT